MSRLDPLELVKEEAQNIAGVTVEENEQTDLSALPAIVIYRAGVSTASTLHTFKRDTEAVRVDIRAESHKVANQIEKQLINHLKRTRRLQTELGSFTDFEEELKVHRVVVTLIVRT